MPAPRGTIYDDGMTDQRIRVLLAEDEANLSQILTTFLRGRGYEVTPCPNGREALESLRSETFDVALLDIVMPEMDGLEVLRAVRSEPEPPEVIIITGNGTIETAISAMRLGAYDYMSKPYRMAEIDLLVRRAWEKRQLLRQNEVLQSRLEHIEASPEVSTRHAPLAEVQAAEKALAGMPKDEARKNIHLFAEKVLPELKSWDAEASIDDRFLEAAE